MGMKKKYRSVEELDGKKEMKTLKRPTLDTESMEVGAT